MTDQPAPQGSLESGWSAPPPYVGIIISIIPLFLGLIWAAFDSRKQGWHDKIAGTVVIRPN